jgi:hypothetical protein
MRGQREDMFTMQLIHREFLPHSTSHSHEQIDHKMNDNVDGSILTKPNDPVSGESHSYMTKSMTQRPNPFAIAVATIDRKPARF